MKGLCRSCNVEETASKFEVWTSEVKSLAEMFACLLKLRQHHARSKNIATVHTLEKLFGDSITPYN